MGKRLYVGNLSWETTQDGLAAAFSANGRTVSDCHIVSDRESGRPRGFAFVEMSSDAEAQAAIRELNGTQLDGREIRVNEAEERKPRPGGGSGQRDASSGGDRGRGGKRW
jgi:RNA recognition motif-containing protein